MKIVTVLRSGSIYTPKHVEVLHKQCTQYAPSAEFVCISDTTEVPGYFPMKHNWPKWWGKIETFSIKGPVLYIDLDTTIVKNIDNILDVCKNNEFISLKDFYPGMGRTVASGVMGWNNDMSYLYEIFLQNPEKHIADNSTNRWWGDQGFIERHVKNPVFWQDLVPNNIVSWKVHCRKAIPSSASIIAFHGSPKPWEVFKDLYKNG